MIWDIAAIVMLCLIFYFLGHTHGKK